MGSNILEVQFAEVVSSIETIKQAVSVMAPEELTETVRELTTNEGKLEGIFDELVSQLKRNLQTFDIDYSSGNKYAIKQGAQLISTNLSDLAAASSKNADTLDSNLQDIQTIYMERMQKEVQSRISMAKSWLEDHGDEFSTNSSFKYNSVTKQIVDDSNKKV